MARIKAKYQKGQILRFKYGEEVTIIEAVQVELARKGTYAVEVAVYRVMYKDEEYYATDIGLDSLNPDIFKRVIAGIGYKGSVKGCDYQKDYDLWKNIIYRCYWKNNNLYSMYGAKGVKVHPKWLCFECFLYDLVKFSNYNAFKKAAKSYDLDIDYKQNKIPMDQRIYGPDLTSLRPYYSTDVYRSHEVLRRLGIEQPIIDKGMLAKMPKNKKTIEDFKPNPDGTWPDEAYQAVIDNPPKLKVPDADADLPIGAVRSLNGLIYTNRPPIIPIFKQSCRGMSLEEINNLIAENKSQSNENAACNTGIEMCKIVKK